MGLFRLRKKGYYICDRGLPHIQRSRLHDFNASVLGLGDLTAPSRDTDAIAVVFDLEGFTKFCTQIDPQLVVSEYLSSFLDWLFEEIKRASCVNESDAKTLDGKRATRRKPKNDDGSVPAFTTLPFFAKFMGDGALFLWDTMNVTENTICSVPAVMTQVCAAYELDFLPKVALSVSDPPPRLRCGIARGRVFSVGSGNDFVGPCINMAARLQKLSSLEMAFSRRGFNADKYMDPHMRGHFLLKRVSIRGIGDSELVYVDASSFEDLPPEEKLRFEEPNEDLRPLTDEEIAAIEEAESSTSKA